MGNEKMGQTKRIIIIKMLQKWHKSFVQNYCNGFFEMEKKN